MGGGLLHVSQRHSDIKGSRDECVPEGKGSNWLCDSCSPGDTPDDPDGPVTVETLAVSADEDGAAVAFADGQVSGSGGTRCHWDGHGLASLAHDGEGAMAALEAQGLDVGPDRF